VISRFHQAILDLRKDADLGAELFRRMNAVYGTVLPGMNVKAKDVEGGVYFVIGPEPQLAAWKSIKESRCARRPRVPPLPRDFWM